ncbi:MAG: Rab family GTPase [Promethearchaeia archaeon]
MVKTLISGILYCQIRKDANVFEWISANDYDMKRKVEKRYESLTKVNLATLNNNCKEETLEIIPFSSLTLKGMIKYIPRDDECSENLINSFLMILFKEVDDLIFYKYQKDLATLFSQYSRKLRQISNHSTGDHQRVHNLLKSFEGELIERLESLKTKELQEKKSEVTEEDQFKIEKKKSFVFKIIVCGDAAVGKTSLVLKFTDNAFRRQYLPTLGVNISEKKLHLNGALIKLMLWDLSGQKKFKMMRTSSYPGALAYIFVFDTTNPKTLKNLEFWYEEVKGMRKTDKQFIGLLLGNKIDLEEKQNIEKALIEKYRSDWNFKYFQTSALTGKNVEEAFQFLAEKLYYLQNTSST